MPLLSELYIRKALEPYSYFTNMKDADIPTDFSTDDGDLDLLFDINKKKGTVYIGATCSQRYEDTVLSLEYFTNNFIGYTERSEVTQLENQEHERTILFTFHFTNKDITHQLGTYTRSYVRQAITDEQKKNNVIYKAARGSVALFGTDLMLKNWHLFEEKSS